MALEVTRVGTIRAGADFARSLAFYREALGYELEASYEDPPYEVADCLGAHRELVAAGVPFLADPYSPPWGGHRCFALDPDGNLIELEQPA